MNQNDKALPMLLGLGNPAERLTRSELVNRALHTALTLLDADAVAFLMTPSRRNVRLLLHAGSTEPAVLPLPPEGSDALRILAEHVQPLLVPDLSNDSRITRDGCPGIEPGPVMFTPLRQRNAQQGYIATYRRRGRASFTMNDTRQMVLVAAWLNSALESLRLSTGTEKGAVTDDLTQVYNYRFLKTALRREIRRASRFGQEVSLVVIDVDHPESNDGENRPAPDGVLLQELASALAPGIRAFDILARYREDKFMVVLPQTGRAGAVEAAERMRAAAEQHAFPQAAAGAITASVGVASYPQDATDLKDLVATADRALHEAQQRGGNCVVTPTAPAASPTRSSPELPRIRQLKRAV